MPSISIKPSLKIDLRAIVDGLSDLDTPELEAFAHEVSTLLAKRKASALSEEETALLMQINQSIPKHVSERFQMLRKKQSAAGLDPEEQAELTRLVDQIEQLEAERLAKMITLAGLWDLSIDELRRRLGLEPPEPHAS